MVLNKNSRNALSLIRQGGDLCVKSEVKAMLTVTTSAALTEIVC